MSSAEWADRRRSRQRAFAASVTSGLTTAAVPVVAGGAPVRPQLLLAGVAMTALLAGHVGWVPGFTLAAIALGAEYSLRLTSRHGLDGVAIVEAIALFATVELGSRALDARSIARPEAAVRRAASLRLTAMLAGAAVSAFVVLALGSRALPVPTAALAFGLAAAVALLVSAELLRRRATRIETR